MNISHQMTAKFIEVTSIGAKGMINIANIASIYPEDGQTVIKTTDGNKSYVNESYESIRKTIDSYLDTAVIKVEK